MPTPAANPLDAFLPPVRAWFEETMGQPTPPQAAGWPAIQRGENTLIMAPTGSGKTLTAFLWGIDQLFRTLPPPAPTTAEKPKRRRRTGAGAPPPQGIHLIYLSPLKALNNDIERNLRVPLAGIRRTAEAMGQELPEIQVAVRSGDTPTRERQAMLRKAPHILITTPESLYILLTSPRARDLFRTVRTLIVDEIHTLVGSKRGVHLALSLERLQHLAEQPIQRIGLSATMRPLEEVARYLGGGTWQGEGEASTIVPRPVTIVDAAYHKRLDLLVETVVEDFRNLAGGSIWPTVITRVNELIEEHRSTLIFVNNRRLAERAADWLNELRAAGGTAAFNPAAGLMEDGVAKGLGMFGAGRGQHAEPIRAHHGSMSKEIRLALENDLKAGQLPAIIGTSSLELGIDIGAVDLVVQLQAPKAVAQGLQRIGRAGHLVGQTSKGRFFPTHREDVMEAAAVAGGMLRGEVEAIHTPRNALDILAQQIVAMVSVENWHVDELYRLIRQAYPYADLGLRAYTRRARNAGRALSQPGARRAAAAHHVGQGQQAAGGAARRAPDGHDERRHDSRPRHLWRLPERRQDQAGRAGRGVCLRDAARRHLYAGLAGLARARRDRRQGGRGRCRRLGPTHALLARRLSLAAVRTGREGGRVPAGRGGTAAGSGRGPGAGGAAGHGSAGAMRRRYRICWPGCGETMPWTTTRPAS